MNNLFLYLYKSYLEYPNNNYVFAQKNWTYEEIYRCTCLLIAKLREEKVNINDNVLLYMDNSIEYIISYFAILYLGATVVPIITSSTAANIHEIIDDCKPVLCLTTNNFISYLNKLGVNSKLKINTVCHENLLALDNGICIDGEGCIEGKLAMIIYTSGTTSKPKGVMLSHKNLLTNTNSILSYLPLNSTDISLITLPFGYSYGNSLLLTHTKVGSLLYLSKGAVFPQMLLTTLATTKITGLSTVGSYLKLLFKQNNFTSEKIKQLKYITLAGEKTDTADLTRLQDMSPDLKIYVMYGQTEASARLTYLMPEMLNKKLGSVGKPIKNVTLKIVDENGKELPDGEVGEIIVAGDNIMLGYLNKAQETQEILKNGWLYTGDIAYKDEDGFVFIVGRKDDIIKHLGHRISPVEIESFLNGCENIIESAVISGYDNTGDISIIAYLVLDNSVIDTEEISMTLKTILKTMLPIYKIPTIYRIINELPKTATGKIKRSELRKMHDLQLS